MAWFGSAKSITKGASPLAPAPVAPATLLGALMPPDAALARSNATAEALKAAARAKKRAAAGGSTLLTQVTGAATPAAVLAPRTLVGR
jgi:hypothetical protein